MDPLSITAGAVALLGVCLRVSLELKKFRNAANEAHITVTAMLADITSLRQVLQSMEDTFDELEAQHLSTGHMATHRRNLLTSLEDGHHVLEQLEELLRQCNKDVALLDQTRRQSRLKSAAENIARFREQIQSYKDTLQLSLQTIILWNSCTIQASTSKILPNLEGIQDDIRRLATNLDVKLQGMQQISIETSQQSQIDSVNNLKSCIRSAATILSSASTVASVEGRGTSADIDEVMSDIGRDRFQSEAEEATRSWVFEPSQDLIDKRDPGVRSPISHGFDFDFGSPQLEPTIQIPASSESNQPKEEMAPRAERSSKLDPLSCNLSEPALSKDSKLSPSNGKLNQPSPVVQKVPTKVERRSFAQLFSRRRPKPEKLLMKLVFVGDGACGKTCFLLRSSKGIMPDVYVATVFENYAVDVEVDKHKVGVALWDTAGQEDYDRLRPLSYSDASAFCICFAIGSPASLDNVREKWTPEVAHFRPRNAPIFLLGLKQDLRSDAQTIGQLLKTGERPVSQDQAEEMRQKIGAVEYLECSAKTGHDVEIVLEIMVRHVRHVIQGKLETADSPKKKERRSLRGLFF